MSRYVVCGAGAIGSILGGYLYRAGKEVVLVGRRPHVDEIRRAGLQLVAGRQTRIKVDAVDSLARIKGRRDDGLVVTVKTQHTASATEALAQFFLIGYRARDGFQRRIAGKILATAAQVDL